MFTKILIANRGEIACRVIATARKMGIKTVAVYSEADANSKHVAVCDEAVLLGPAAAKESYLCGDKIIADAEKQYEEEFHRGVVELAKTHARMDAAKVFTEALLVSWLAHSRTLRLSVLAFSAY